MSAKHAGPSATAAGYRTRLDGTDYTLCADCVDAELAGGDELAGAELVSLVPGPRAEEFDCEWCEEPFMGVEGSSYFV